MCVSDLNLRLPMLIRCTAWGLLGCLMSGVLLYAMWSPASVLQVTGGTEPLRTSVTCQVVAIPFVLRNCSRNPVTVSSVRTNCPCVTVDCSTFTVMPGSARSILVTVDTTGSISTYNYKVLCISDKPYRTLAMITGSILIHAVGGT
jgi:hypothetical protein